MKTKICMIALTALAFSGAASAALTLQDDVVRDGTSDILFRGGTALAYWRVVPYDWDRNSDWSFTSHYAGDGGPGYRVVAVSDFDGEGSADVLWTNGTQLKMWINNGSGSYTAVPAGTYGGGWEPFAARDINGDRKSDILFRGGTHLAYRLINGPTVLSDSYFGDGGSGYRVIALEDFDKDDVADVLWTNGSQLKVWLSRAGHATTMIGSYGGGWEAFAAGDIDRDGTADIMFRGGTHLAYWLMDANARVRGSFYGGDGGTGFRAIGVGDYSVRDPAFIGYASILWTDGSQIKLWLPSFSRNEAGKLVFQSYWPLILGRFGGGWEPLDELIPQAGN